MHLKILLFVLQQIPQKSEGMNCELVLLPESLPELRLLLCTRAKVQSAAVKEVSLPKLCLLRATAAPLLSMKLPELRVLEIDAEVRNHILVSARQVAS